MGFDWDKHESSGGNFITASEKKALAENGIPFTINAISIKHKFENEHYELAITVPNPEDGENEERTLSFPIGTGAESRDSMLAGMKEYLDGDGSEPVQAKLEKIGRGYYLRQAD